MAGAFRESPSYKHMLESRGEAKREVLLASLFEKNLALQKDACWCSRRPEDGSLQCAFLLTPSDAPPVSFFRMVRGGLLQLLLQWGLGPVGRLLRAKAWHERSYAEALGTRPHLVLERMAVSKNQRGGGIGTATLAGALAVDADAKGLPVVLTTQEARNVRFYRRLGFEVDGAGPRRPAADEALWQEYLVQQRRMLGGIFPTPTFACFGASVLLCTARVKPKSGM